MCNTIMSPFIAATVVCVIMSVVFSAFESTSTTLVIKYSTVNCCLARPCGLRRRSTATYLLGLHV